MPAFGQPSGYAGRGGPRRSQEGRRFQQLHLVTPRKTAACEYAKPAQRGPPSSICSGAREELELDLVARLDVRQRHTNRRWLKGTSLAVYRRSRHFIDTGLLRWAVAPSRTVEGTCNSSPSTECITKPKEVRSCRQSHVRDDKHADRGGSLASLGSVTKLPILVSVLGRQSAAGRWKINLKHGQIILPHPTPWPSRARPPSFSTRSDSRV